MCAAPAIGYIHRTIKSGPWTVEESLASPIVDRFPRFHADRCERAARSADDRATCFSGSLSGPVRDDNVAACTRLIEAKKDLVRAYVQRAALYIRRGDNWNQAIADLGEALRLDSKNVDALALHGALTFKGDAARAVAEMNEAIRLEPKYGYPYKNRGMIHENKGELDKALADFRMALNLDPEKKERLGREAAQGIERVQQKLAAPGGSRPAPVASTDDQAICFKGAIGDENAAACSRLIASGRLSGGELARVFQQRAAIAIRKGDFDASMADVPKRSDSIRTTSTLAGCAPPATSDRAST